MHSPVKMQGRENNVERGNVKSYLGGLTNCILVLLKNLSGHMTKKKYCLSSNKSLGITGQKSPNIFQGEVITTLRIIFIVA